VSALVRSHGVHYIWQFWAPVIGSVLAFVYFGRKWRRMAFVTDIEFMEARYGGAPAKALVGCVGSDYHLPSYFGLGDQSDGDDRP